MVLRVSSSPGARSLPDQFCIAKKAFFADHLKNIRADLRVWNIPTPRSGREPFGEEARTPPETERGPPPARPRGPEEGDGSARKVSLQLQPEEDEAQAAVPASREQPPPVARVPDTAGERSSPRSPQPSKERLRFQFLEQKYGYYHCKDCNIRWESAYVWCVQGTNKVYYKQFCRTCQKSYNPYRVEDITCQNCKQTRCSCPVKLRHVDPKRPHRQDLCGRCKGKRLSCDSTFSFKYII
ncbi:PREDICTED: zygote arrest protein 1 [Bison bison bison]|uniref:Zygote arrest protein 1 n=1 Tax=Bison bison bison TaxID=43346 RepID=A0A6P3J1P9_BISBB|nr:PREDICTED: zygote arrest protein 1 [Bison bison bison]